MKKIYVFLLTLCLTMTALSGCGLQKPAATDSVKAIYDLYILGDTSGAVTLGMTEDDIAAAESAYETALADTIRANFSASGLEIDDETVTAICQARKSALAKMNAKYTLVSQDEDTSVVTLSTTYFDEVTLDTDAAYAARDQADNAGFTDYDEYMTFIMERYTQNLIEGYENVTPSEDTREISVTCIIVDNMWLPEDMAAFGSELGLAVAGQE